MRILQAPALVFTVALTIGWRAVLAQPPGQGNWQLVWQDDFTSTNVDFDGGWIAAEEFKKNNEAAVFLESNVTIDPNLGLVLKLQRQDFVYDGPNNNQTPIEYKYTSGAVGSWTGWQNEPREIRYGYIEARMKVSNTYGVWASFWLWTDQLLCQEAKSTPGKDCRDSLWNTTECGGAWVCDYEEMDLCEILNGAAMTDSLGHGYGDPMSPHDQFSYTTNFHWFDNPRQYVAHGVGDYTEFHDYGLWWRNDSLLFFLDGTLVRAVDNPGFNQVTTIQLGLNLNPGVRSPVFAGPDYDIYSPDTDYFNVPLDYSHLDCKSVNDEAGYMIIERIRYFELP